MRDHTKLERQEKQLEAEIKAAAKKGDVNTAKTLAKNLIQLRKAKDRSRGAASKLSAFQSQATTMQATATMAKSMGAAAKTMGAMNAQIKPEEIAKIMGQFEQESMKMDMSQEIMDDTLDSLFDDPEMEGEQDAIMAQVLDEIGLDVAALLPNANTAGPVPTNAAAEAEENALIARLAGLRTPA